MRTKHKELFVKFDATFKRATVEVWEKMVQEWERDNEKPNPYAEPINSTYFIYSSMYCLMCIPLATTEHDIRLQLLEEEVADSSQGVLLPHDTSPSLVLRTGLELEEQQ
jgi:hypothetical protein